MQEILLGLRQPEYLHILLNHLPLIGLPSGLFILFIAALQKNRGSAIAALVLIFLSSISVVAVSATGERSVDRMEGLIDSPGRAWMHEHEDRAEKVVWLYYGTAALALSGLAAARFATRTFPTLCTVTAALALFALAGGVWTASAGGKIMHREFRYSPPPDRERS